MVSPSAWGGVLGELLKGNPFALIQEPEYFAMLPNIVFVTLSPMP